MRKILLSIFLCASVILNNTMLAIALIPKNYAIAFSEINNQDSSYQNRLQVEYSARSFIDKSLHKQEFVVKQYKNNELIEEVRGKIGGSSIEICKIHHGLVVSKAVRSVSDFVTKTSANILVRPYVYFQSDNGTRLGCIIYNKSFESNEERELTVYSKITKRDIESFRVHGTAADTVAAIVGAAVSIGIGKLLGSISISGVIEAIISSLGGSIAGGAIGIFFDEVVAVDATYYSLRGYHEPSDYYSPEYNGVTRLVKTRNSKVYNEWFYEGFTPHNWKEGPLANMLYIGTFGGTYPYVKEYC